MKITLEEIANRLEGELTGNYENILVSNVAGLKEAVEGDISFLAHRRHIKDLENTRASAVAIPRDLAFDRLPAIKVDNPYYAFSQLLNIFYEIPDIRKGQQGIDERAVIGNNVQLGNNVTIYPFVYIQDCVTIGENVIIYPGTFIGEGSSVGSNTLIYPNVTIREDVTIGAGVIIHSGAVIGSDGFGYVFHKGIHHKIPQKGGVIIEDNVEIGANTTIDRGTLGNTIIKRGTKIDNLVQVAHNVTIGEDCIFAAQAGIAGSSTIGKRVTLAGQAGVTGHVKVGDNVTVAAKAGVTKEIKDGQTVSGMPAIQHKDWLRTMAVFDGLPELRQKLLALENKVKEMEKASTKTETERHEEKI
ncbi:MAG: UDP-3-O-(3-hydroxymyristoyl)glucosamine N-acyltransferase [Nitrospirae bacterium]|nr:UDP-3-O-(3-hydroxymyristoyl)glucosamine N-acyltransferase [Nitrospirota bacterium]